MEAAPNRVRFSANFGGRYIAGNAYIGTAQTKEAIALDEYTARRQTIQRKLSRIERKEYSLAKDYASRGQLIAIDGIDGAGKSTQQRLLANWLQQQGVPVVCCRDPGSTALGEQVRRLLLERPSIAIAPRSEMFLYMAARAQLVEEIIRPALNQGQVVITDRYLLANVVYQGYGACQNVDEIWQVGQIAVQGILPSLTIVLDLPVAEGLRRLGRTPDRIESRGEAFLERVRQGYLAEAARQSESIRVISAEQPIDQVAGQIQQYVAPLVARLL